MTNNPPSDKASLDGPGSVPDALFTDPRLAPLYDLFDGDRDDLPAYLTIIESLRPARILDVGCGTGALATLLAGTGHTVIGADPAAASLDVARTKPAADRVTWLHTGAAGLPQAWPLPEPADLALMTGNVAQVFVTDDDWTAALRGIHAVLRPGGHLVFEARRPEFRAWEQWDHPPATAGGVERRFMLTDVRLPLVSFRYEYRFLSDETVLTSTSTLCFRDRSEIEESLRATGFEVLEVRAAPDRPGRENVFLCRRAGTA
ncbi:methyltransferase type 11 [Actinoplanes sp. SE50]|uniref:class I SAM-dependent methyltransferase n=1 Tax=unclassified Actinoplanes TaxID=2626549 RepID=UPI00023EC366|nr:MULTISPECIES: class I SAM-dependent methyltransferase [unclassified Actinoplanes]AEV87544.1 Ubiquinone/menaquinone biosynthesis methyltransferase ubiE [Actinoplanes sp. SE50/110]ATO85947.1 methyltransferase type 11 [Actinoplanes sp. SE50]SLM03361.1 methyltransferase type 11 [Actinoplanes sp. SE50/110]